LKIAWLRSLQLSDEASRLLQELHLSQVRAERVSCRGDGSDGGVASFLGGLSNLLGSVPKRLPFLAD
jgi:hypothetical protein